MRPKKRCITKKRRETHRQRKVIPLTSEQIEARRANARAHYANLKPEQRQTIRDRQKLLYANMTAEKKHAKRNREKTRCVIRQNTPSKNSIAVENPLYDSSDSY
jgi:DNA-binding PadR family transcriptional regulator